MKMSNKSAGTQFEREFAARLAAEGFWVHRFQDNKNGQPCDVIAARNGEAYLFDCKDCKTDTFSLRRVEENQFNAMRLFDTTGNRRGMSGIRIRRSTWWIMRSSRLSETMGRAVFQGT